MKRTSQQQAWLDAGVAQETDDMLWAKPHVDEARQAVARGEIMTLDEFNASVVAEMAELQKKYG